MIGTDRNVDRRLPAAAEVEVPFYAGLEIGVPSLPGMVEVLAEGRFDLVHVTAPGPAGRDRHADRPDHGAAGARQLAHRARRLRRPALRVAGSWSAGMDAALSLFYRQCAPGAVAQPRQRRVARPPRRRARPHRPLGPRGRHLPLRPGACATRTPTPARSRSSTSGGQTKEKGVELLADSFLRAHEARPAAAPAARRRRPRGGAACASGSATARDLPRLARRRRPAPRLRERRHLPLLQPDRHLRPGPGRGRRQRAAGGRRRRGRPDLDRRRRRDRAPLRARPGDDRGGVCCSSPTPRPGAPSSAARAWPPPGRAPGRRRWASSRTATPPCSEPAAVGGVASRLAAACCADRR